MPSRWGMLEHVRKEGGNGMLTKCKHTNFSIQREERMKIRERNFRHFSAMHYHQKWEHRFSRTKYYSRKTLSIEMFYVLLSNPRDVFIHSQLSRFWQIHWKKNTEKKKFLWLFFKLLHMMIATWHSTAIALTLN